MYREHEHEKRSSLCLDNLPHNVCSAPNDVANTRTHAFHMRSTHKHTHTHTHKHEHTETARTRPPSGGGCGAHRWMWATLAALHIVWPHLATSADKFQCARCYWTKWLVECLVNARSIVVLSCPNKCWTGIGGRVSRLSLNLNLFTCRSWLWTVENSVWNSVWNIEWNVQ